MDGKVALVTGAARGQGRSHAVRLAQEGADIVAVDLCGQLETVPYAMATRAQLDETVAAVEELDRRIVARQADVRSGEQMRAAVADGLAEFGHIDVVSANAGIFASVPYTELTEQDWDEMIGTNLTGVHRTVQAVLPSMIERGRGGSIVLTSSTAGIKGFGNLIHYTAAKHGVVGLMRGLVQEVSHHGIRVNTVHPTAVNTDMIQNQTMYNLFSPGDPTREAFGKVFSSLHTLPVQWVDPVDISNAVLWLASDESRYVTGIMVPVDAGFCEKVG